MPSRSTSCASSGGIESWPAAAWARCQERAREIPAASAPARARRAGRSADDRPRSVALGFLERVAQGHRRDGRARRFARTAMTWSMTSRDGTGRAPSCTSTTCARLGQRREARPRPSRCAPSRPPRAPARGRRSSASHSGGVAAILRRKHQTTVQITSGCDEKRPQRTEHAPGRRSGRRNCLGTAAEASARAPRRRRRRRRHAASVPDQLWTWSTARRWVEPGDLRARSAVGGDDAAEAEPPRFGEPAVEARDRDGSRRRARAHRGRSRRRGVGRLCSD